MASRRTSLGSSSSTADQGMATLLTPAAQEVLRGRHFDAREFLKKPNTSTMSRAEEIVAMKHFRGKLKIADMLSTHPDLIDKTVTDLEDDILGYNMAPTSVATEEAPDFSPDVQKIGQLDPMWCGGVLMKSDLGLDAEDWRRRWLAGDGNGNELLSLLQCDLSSWAAIRIRNSD